MRRQTLITVIGLASLLVASSALATNVAVLDVSHGWKTMRTKLRGCIRKNRRLAKPFKLKIQVNVDNGAVTKARIVGPQDEYTRCVQRTVLRYGKFQSAEQKKALARKKAEAKKAQAKKRVTPGRAFVRFTASAHHCGRLFGAIGTARVEMLVQKDGEVAGVQAEGHNDRDVRACLTHAAQRLRFLPFPDKQDKRIVWVVDLRPNLAN